MRVVFRRRYLRRYDPCGLVSWYEQAQTYTTIPTTNYVSSYAVLRPQSPKSGAVREYRGHENSRHEISQIPSTTRTSVPMLFTATYRVSSMSGHRMCIFLHAVNKRQKDITHRLARRSQLRANTVLQPTTPPLVSISRLDFHLCTSLQQ
jgi:hypothetical protein